MNTTPPRSVLRHATCFALGATLLTACAAPTGEDPDEDIDTVEDLGSSLTSSQRRERAGRIRDAAAGEGLIGSGWLLAGIADAETQMAHCWYELTWACQGPYSADCGGPVVAGAGDGPCYLQEGGLGMFQFDAGTFSDTLAREGNRILSIAGNTQAGVDFVVNMVINSVYIGGVSNRAQAIAWMNGVTPTNSRFHPWIQTVTHYYNGCRPSFSCYSQRYGHYRDNARGVYYEMGASFWEDTSGGGTVTPALEVAEGNSGNDVTRATHDTWLKISTASSGSLSSTQKCFVSKGQNLVLVPENRSEQSGHTRVKLELALPGCALTDGYLYSEHFEAGDPAADTAPVSTVTVTAVNDTVLKRTTAQSSSLPASDKCLLAAGTRFDVTAEPEPAGSHVRVTLAEALPGCSLSGGYLYAPHVTTAPATLSMNVLANTWFKRSEAQSSSLGSADKCALGAGERIDVLSANASGVHELVTLASPLAGCSFTSGYVYGPHVSIE